MALASAPGAVESALRWSFASGPDGKDRDFAGVIDSAAGPTWGAVSALANRSLSARPSAVFTSLRASTSARLAEGSSRASSSATWGTTRAPRARSRMTAPVRRFGSESSWSNLRISLPLEATMGISRKAQSAEVRLAGETRFFPNKAATTTPRR